MSLVRATWHVQENHGVTVLDFGGETVSIDVNWFAQHKAATLVATGSYGTANESLVFQNGACPKARRPRKGEVLALQIPHFLRCVRTDVVQDQVREAHQEGFVALGTDLSVSHSRRAQAPV